MKTGIDLIREEREEQLIKHGRSVESDVSLNTKRELMNGARQLLKGGDYDVRMRLVGMPMTWDDDVCYNMVKKSYKERLITAGALIAAEIDRIDN